MSKPLWQKTFKNQADYEIARLELMIQLTSRVIRPGTAHDFLREQVSRLRERANEWEKTRVDKKTKRR